MTMKYALAALATLVAFPGRAQDAPDAGETQAGDDAATCVQAPEPVVSLSYGSRYTAGSEDRSDFDESSNAEVNAALKPVDDFIVDLANGTNLAQRGGDDAAGAADCVLDAILVWAEADALSDLGTMNAQISSPSRLGGIALAYLQAAPLASADDPGRRTVIDGWLIARMQASMVYFDTEAPPGSSRNNLRAWAGLAGAAVGSATGDAAVLDWAAGSLELVACQADADGALPLEMGRGALALHYQLHAAAPLVVGAALLADEERDLFEVCDGAIHRIVAFVPKAFNDPSLVEAKAGERQSYVTGEEELKGFQLAWADAYLARFANTALSTFVEGYRPLANSKLGGAQELLW